MPEVLLYRGAKLEGGETADLIVEDGVIAEAWYFGDELGLLRAIGANPPDLTKTSE